MIKFVATLGSHTMTPALRHNEADRKLVLLAIWKLLWCEIRRNTTSTQITAAPRTQAMMEKAVRGCSATSIEDRLTHARDGAHHPTPEIIGSHGGG